MSWQRPHRESWWSRKALMPVGRGGGTCLVPSGPPALPSFGTCGLWAPWQLLGLLAKAVGRAGLQGPGCNSLQRAWALQGETFRAPGSQAGCQGLWSGGSRGLPIHCWGAESAGSPPPALWLPTEGGNLMGAQLLLVGAAQPEASSLAEAGPSSSCLPSWGQRGHTPACPGPPRPLLLLTAHGDADITAAYHGNACVAGPGGAGIEPPPETDAACWWGTVQQAPAIP